MINPWSFGQSNLADNLRPHMQRGSSLLPLRKREIRPKLLAFVTANLHFVPAFFLRPSNLNSKHRALLPVDKIGKRAFHSLKRASRFFLGSMEGVRDPRFDAANNAAFIFSVIIVFHVFHARTGKHSFCAPDSAASRPDVYRPDWARRFI